MQGWYPDPGGASGRYRYWDGAAWSTTTTDDPRDPPPGHAGPGTPPRRSRWGMVIGLLALVVILVIGVSLLAGNLGRTADEPLPSSTVSGWDDSSPTDSPTPSRLATPSPSGATSVPLVPCPEGRPNERRPHPADGRVYGGNLSFAAQRSFARAAPEPRFSFGYDVTQQYLAVNDDPGWIAQLAVGQLRASDGFTGSPRNTAESLVQCALGGLMYAQYHPRRTDLRSVATTVDGQQAWLVEVEIRVTAPGLPFPGDHAVFLVVRNGADWGFFFGAAPIGDAKLGQVLQDTTSGLRAS